MLDIYGTLEISKVLEEVAFYSRSEIARERILSLKMLPKEKLGDDLTKLDEMMSYLMRFGDISFTTSINLFPIVENASKGGVLTAIELDKIASDIDSSNRIFKQFSKIDKNQYFNLFSLANSLYDLTPLGKNIRKIVLPNLLIADNASPALASIRASLVRKEHEVRGMTNDLTHIINSMRNMAAWSFCFP